MLIGPTHVVAALSVRADSTRTQSFVLGVAVPAFMAACASVWQAAKLASVGVSAYTLTAAATRLAHNGANTSTRDFSHRVRDERSNRWRDPRRQLTLHETGSTPLPAFWDSHV
jgi:hypothetical protein